MRRKRVLIALRMAVAAGREKLAGVFRYLGARHDWDVTLVRTATEFTPARMCAALDARYDGFIVSIPGTEDTAAHLADSTLPTVVMDLHDPALQARRTNIVFIRNSAHAIGTTAARELMGTGICRSYAFVHNPQVAEWSRARLDVFRETLRDHGFWCNELETPSGLERLERPVGVLAANDDCGYGIVEYCHAKRLRIPRDVLVLGINNDSLICENCRPPLSSVQPDFEREGFLAAECLDRMMKRAARRPSAAQTLQVGVRQVVRRDSTGSCAPSGILVQKALAFIRKNALRGIGVEDVVRDLGCSRRLADLRFRQLQGETIGARIVATQLEEAQRLLLATDLTIETIAERCGYSSPSYLMTLFRRRFGLTMGAFRNATAQIPFAKAGTVFPSPEYP